MKLYNLHKKQVELSEENKDILSCNTTCTLHVHLVIAISQCMYSQTCLFWSPWDPKHCPDYRSVLISEVHIYIVMGPRLTVLIIEVSLFQSVHNSRFDCSISSLGNFLTFQFLLLEESLKMYQQKLEEIQKLEEQQKTKSPVLQEGISFKQPYQLNYTDLPGGNPPCYYETQPHPFTSLQCPPMAPHQPQSINSGYYPNQSMLHSHTIYPPRPHYPPPSLHYNSFPPSLPVHPFNIPQQHIHQSPWLQQTDIDRSDKYQSWTVGDVPAPVIEANRQRVKTPNSQTVLSNNTWCTLPESDPITESIPLCESLVDDESHTQTNQRATDLVVVDTEITDCNLSHDGTESLTADSSMSLPSVCNEDSDVKIVHTQNTSTQTDVPSCPQVQSSTNTIVHSPVVKHQSFKSANELHTIAHTNTSAQSKAEQSTRKYSPSCQSRVDHEEIKEAELLSMMLNQSPTMATISCLDELSISLIDNEHQHNNSSTGMCINVDNDIDDEQILQEIFYV